MVICVDVTEMLNVNFISGIQRVVKEILVRWIKNHTFELLLLKYDFKKAAFCIVDNDKFYEYYSGKIFSKVELMTGNSFLLQEFNDKMIFFDMDSVWMNFCKRSWLLPILKKQGVKTAALIYDIIPVTDSQYCHEFTTFNFMEYLGAHLKYSDLIITNANATKYAISDLVLETEVKSVNCQVVTLGSDFEAKDNERQLIREQVKSIVAKGRYVLMVGTLEPRKNHQYVLRAFEKKLFQKNMNLIFAGRVGWNIEKFVQEVHQHSEYGTQLFHVTDASDNEVDYMYEHAFSVAFPSFNEGFGLPIIEAFDRGIPVLAADIPVLREVGGDYCEYFDLNNIDEFVREIEELMNKPEKYCHLKKKVEGYKKTLWEETAVDMAALFTNL